MVCYKKKSHRNEEYMVCEKKLELPSIILIGAGYTLLKRADRIYLLLLGVDGADRILIYYYF